MMPYARLLAAVCATLLLPLASIQSIRAQTPALDVPIAVSSTSFVLGGLRIAENAGIFAKHGVQPKIIVMESGNAAMSALISKSVNFAIAGPPEALAARARKQDILIAGNLYRGLAGSIVVLKTKAAQFNVKADAPIADRLRALNGLRVAFPSATSSLLGPLRSAADTAGSKIQYTYMAQPAMVAALETGAIDAMMASYPFAGVPVLKGTGVIWIDGPAGDLPEAAQPTSSSSLLTSGAYAKANSDVVKRMQQAIIESGEFIKNKPDEAKRALAVGYKDLDQKAIDIAFAEQWRNWTQPRFSAADIAHEIVLLEKSGQIPGLRDIDPQAMLLQMP
jgi:ABC-type nitrate/sulfonate/bicarbonate transport system substrate-binding protein